MFINNNADINMISDWNGTVLDGLKRRRRLEKDDGNKSAVRKIDQRIQLLREKFGAKYSEELRSNKPA